MIYNRWLLTFLLVNSCVVLSILLIPCTSCKVASNRDNPIHFKKIRQSVKGHAWKRKFPSYGYLQGLVLFVFSTKKQCSFWILEQGFQSYCLEKGESPFKRRQQNKKWRSNFVILNIQWELNCTKKSLTFLLTFSIYQLD